MNDFQLPAGIGGDHAYATGRAVGDAIELVRNPRINRRAKRKEIRTRLKQIDGTAKAINDLQICVQQWNAELSEAVENHQATCTKLQDKLATNGIDAERRVALREQINQANEVLAEISDRLNPKINAANNEIAALTAQQHGRIQLEQGLITSGEPEKLRLLEVLRRTERYYSHRVEALKKEIWETEEELRFGKSSPHREEMFTGYFRPKPVEKHRWAAELISKAEETLKTLYLEQEHATRAYSEALRAVRELEDEIRSE